MSINFESYEAVDGSDYRSDTPEFVEAIDRICNARKYGETPIVLGSGTTGAVVYSTPGNKLCVKKGDMTMQEGDNYAVGGHRELEVQNEVYKISQEVTGVRVPQPIAIAESQDGSRYFLMERVGGLSVADIINQDIILPSDFDLTGFFNKLRNFVERIHQRQLFHRDIHQGNIMIGGEVEERDGKKYLVGSMQPYLIDFGTAKEVFPNDDPYQEELVVGSTPVFIRDEEGLRIVRAMLAKKLASDAPAGDKSEGIG